MAQSGKLRASWGQVGNDSGSGYYAYYGLYGSWTQNSKPAYVVSQNPARDLHWETGESWGAAVEGRLFNRLNLSVEYFDKGIRTLFSAYMPPVQQEVPAQVPPHQPQTGT